MNDIDRYYKILKIDGDNITEKDLRTAYYKGALKYHPDKNSDSNATEKFQEINLAYEKLMIYHKFTKNNTFSADNANDSSFNSTLYSFLKPFFELDSMRDFQTNIILSIIEKISEKCEDKAISMLKNLNNETYKKIYNILYGQKDILHIPESFFEKMVEIYKEKKSNDKIIRIFPNVSDLLDENVYKLVENDQEYLIPLWHHELIYDDDDKGEITVLCCPKIEKNMEIDENNNIHIYKTYNLQELWDLSQIEIEIGKKTLKIQRDGLKLIEKQTITIPNVGIPRINNKNIYDTSKKGNIYINIEII